MPRTIMAFVLAATGIHPAGLAVLSVAVFALSAVPLDRIEVDTVVAVVSGLSKLNDPWGDLVNWGREFSVVGVKYRLFADAVRWLGNASAGTGAGALAAT